MANTYFKFKQFTIHQDRCAMKVCTDACLFGALVAHRYMDGANSTNTLQCLDIGTGTGLLSLMFAQKNNNVHVDAIELDPAAAAQAGQNIGGSPWAENIQVIDKDLLAFDPGKSYDCIFSNPPFFEDDLQSPDRAKNKAKHHSSLNLAELVGFADKHISTDGKFAVLLPFQRVDYFIEEASSRAFYLTKKILVKQTFKHKFFRGILFFGRQPGTVVNEEITIKKEDNEYSAEFTLLLKEYYLFL
ncbi:MAG: methyltransferase [Chitinophagaceae bacterium]|nr:methyltransferase [Chitinophagaceae bacterium]